MNRLLTREEGFALLMTLWVLAVLSVLLLTLTMMAGSNMKASGYFSREVASHYLLRGGLYRMAAELEPDVSLGKNAELEAIRGEMLGVWVVSPSDWSVQKLDEQDAGEALKEYAGEVICEVISEDAKLPLNKATKEMLVKLPNLSPVMAEEIISMRKAKEREGGIRLVEEILHVEGVPEAYAGEEDKPGLRDLVTTYSDGRIFLNGANQHVLKAIPEVGEVVAREIEERIKNGHHMERVEDINQVLGVTKNIFKSLKMWGKVKTEFYRIRASTVSGGVGRTAEGVVRVTKDGVETIYMSGGG